MKPSRKTKGKTHGLQLQLMAKKSQQTQDDCVIKTACMQRLQKQAASPPPLSWAHPSRFTLPSCLRLQGRWWWWWERTLAGVGSVSSGQPALQICLHTNNISLAKVRLDGELQIKVRKTDCGEGERGGKFACQAITIESYPQLIVLLGMEG